uniref:Reverse transcriptase zinc-binding domain-containing protein n=1 Tax=Chenopodium quinoa TaxID=63459 RepID=A0A803M6K6_CHEQI
MASDNLQVCQSAMHQNPNDTVKRSLESEARKEYSIAQQNYVSFLRQKSKVTWILQGDQNSVVFHASLKKSQLQNNIYTIHDMASSWINDLGEVPNAFLQYYDSLLGNSDDCRLQIDAICRNYLWGGDMKHRSGYFSWDMVCRRKKEGGLGEKHRGLELCNSREICLGVKDKMKSVLDPAQIGQGMYNISRMYKVLRPDLTGYNWDKLVWEKWAAPKHKFIGLIAWHNRLMTRDRLLRFGTPTYASCLLCGDMQEDHEHLFFKCKYSQMIWKEISARRASVYTGLC